ncbi:MAG: segregation/condensation protein A [Candidatus Obscuribacterales bacterium]|jgi:segregation and condensation protein A|nr:segregation/condensation protein A [Candidatus Obscuribacterales bacterium]
MPDPLDLHPLDTFQMPLPLGEVAAAPPEESAPTADADPAVPPPAPYLHLIHEKDSGGIEILVQMAEKGEIDPKNIDIIDATDRFLKAIAAAPRENLRRSGKIIFHASVLLRMKAEALLITKIEDLDAGGDDFLDFDDEGSPLIYDSNNEAVGRQITLNDLQRALVRRSRQRQSRHRRVTLEQLIEAIREAERMEKKREERRERQPKAVIAMDGYHDMQDMDDILDLAHDEDIEDVIARIETLLVKKMEEMLRMELAQLIGMLDGKGDWVDAFLAVLFLSNAGKINLEQEIFYGPLYLVKNAVVENLLPTGTESMIPENEAQ